MEEEFIYTVYDLTKMFNISSAIFYNRVSKLKLNTPMYSKKIYNNKAKREIHHFNKEAVDILKEEFEPQKQKIDTNFKYSAKDFLEEFSITRKNLNLYLKEIFEEKGEKFKEENRHKFLIKNEKSSNLTYLYTKEVYDLLEEKIIEEKTLNVVENLKIKFPQFTNKPKEEIQEEKTKDLTQNQIEEIEHLFYDKVKSIDKISEILKIDKEKVRSVLSKNFYKTEEKENKENRKEVKNMEDKKTKTKGLSLNDLLKIFDFKTQGVHIYKDDFRYSLDSTENKEFTNEKFISTFKEDILDSEIIKIVSRSDKNIIDIYLK